MDNKNDLFDNKNDLLIAIGVVWLILFFILNIAIDSMTPLFFWILTLVASFLISFGTINKTSINKILKIILIIVSTIILSLLFWLILWALSGFAI